MWNRELVWSRPWEAVDGARLHGPGNRSVKGILMGAIQPWHLILLLIVVLVVFGPGKLPEIGKSLGESIREFRKATTETRDAISSQPPVQQPQVQQPLVAAQPAPPPAAPTVAPVAPVAQVAPPPAASVAEAPRATEGPEPQPPQ